MSNVTSLMGCEEKVENWVRIEGGAIKIEVPEYGWDRPTRGPWAHRVLRSCCDFMRRQVGVRNSKSHS